MYFKFFNCPNYFIQNFSRLIFHDNLSQSLNIYPSLHLSILLLRRILELTQGRREKMSILYIELYTLLAKKHLESK